MPLSKSLFQIESVLYLALILAAPTRAIAQTTETYSNMDFALSAVRRTFNVSTGLELSVGDRDKTPIVLDLSGNSVARVFDSLVKQRPKYRWVLNDGFYDVYPKAKAQSFSQVRVASYVVTDASLREAVDHIDKLPEVERWLANHHKRRQDLIGGSRLGPAPPEEKRSVNLQDVTVRTVLNRVYRSFDQKQWTIWNQGQDIGMSFSF